jgi:hypothetical protein
MNRKKPTTRIARLERRVLALAADRFTLSDRSSPLSDAVADLVLARKRQRIRAARSTQRKGGPCL